MYLATAITDNSKDNSHSKVITKTFYFITVKNRNKYCRKKSGQHSNMCETFSVFSRINYCKWSKRKSFPLIEYFYSSDAPINIKICRKNVLDSHKTGGNFQAGKPDRLRIVPGWHFAYMRIPTRFRSCRSLSFPLSFLVYRGILKIAPRTVYKQT